MRRRPPLILALMILFSGCASASIDPANGSTTATESAIWTADFMRTQPDQQERYLRYLEVNWARARRTAVAQGQIRSFRVLVASPDSSRAWDIVLLTEYPDSVAYSRREAIFGPILEAQGETLIEGFSGGGRENALKITVASAVLRAPIGSP